MSSISSLPLWDQVRKPFLYPKPVFTLAWLRTLRWTAVLGQSATVLWVHFGLRLTLPLAPVFSLIAFTAFTNLLLRDPQVAEPRGSWWITGILATDVVILTELLYLTGGSYNPFSVFYLVHVALAAVVLHPFQSSLIAGLCAVGFASLFSPSMESSGGLEAICGIGPSMPTALHLRGMLISFILATACIVVFVARLQSALRRREDELTQSQQRAVQQERFVALATLAAGAAHELGTPLGTISIAAGEIVRAADELSLPEDITSDATLICDETRRCRTILDRLQQTADDPPQRLTMASLFERVRNRLGAASHVAVFDSLDSALTVCVPPEALTMATLSLVRNAIEASPPGKTVRVQASAANGHVQIRVVDQGEGLTESATLHAGEPFFTTKPPGKGMGLGLFLVRLLAERIGGSFRLERNQPQGTCALFEIPFAP